MKLSKSKLAKLVSPKLSELGYTGFKDSLSGYQGLFVKNIQRGFYISLGLIIHRYYDNAFTADFYLSNTTRIGSLWGDIPRESCERIGFLLTDEERAAYFPDDEVNERGSHDTWWDANNSAAIDSFLEVVTLTESRFIDQPELMRKISASKEVAQMARDAELVKKAIVADELYGTCSFLPPREIDEIPLAWFMAAEKVLKDNSGILNKNTVKLLAADAYRQYMLG